MKTCPYCEKYCQWWQEDGCHYADDCDFKQKVKVADSPAGSTGKTVAGKQGAAAS